MSHISDEAASRGKEDIFLIRSACFIGGLVYPIWSIVYQQILPDVDDPISRRLQISALAALNILLTFFPIKRSHLVSVLFSSMSIATMHLVWIAYLNNFHPYYQIGILVLICATLPFFQNLTGLALYTSLSSLSFLCLVFFFDFSDLFIFYVACLTVFIVSSYALMTRLGLIAKLRKSREEFALSADRIAAVNRDISSIMQHIPLGVFTIESDNGLLGKQHSHFLQSIIGKPPVDDCTLFDILQDSDLGTDEIAKIRSLLSFIGDDPIEFEPNSHLLPKESTLNTPSGAKKYIEFEWSPVIDPKQEILQKILVSMRDVTDIRILMRQNEDKDLELKLISEIISLDRTKIVTAFSSLKKLLDRCQAELEKRSEQGQNKISMIFREIHTVKGLARSFQLSRLANTSHLVEDQLRELKSKNTDISIAELKNHLQPVFSCYELYAKIVTGKLGISIESSASIAFSQEEIEWMIGNLRFTMEKENSDLDYIREMYHFMLKRSGNSIEDILAEIIDHLPGLAHELGKPAPKIQIEGSRLSFLPSSHNILQSIFAHILRNSLDHGIEDPNERIQQGKDSVGHIRIHVRQEDGQVHFRIHDDGRGLNLEKIYSKALGLGLIDGKNKLTPNEIADLIFLSDFSTKDTVSQISGRGIGMDAVRTYLKSFGGTIHLEIINVSGNFAQFSLNIALPDAFMVAVNPNNTSVDRSAAFIPKLISS